MFEGFCRGDYLSMQRAAFGENFVACGEVVLSEWEDVKKALTSPQARTFRLGTSPLSANRFTKTKKGDTTFVSATSCVLLPSIVGFCNVDNAFWFESRSSLSDKNDCFHHLSSIEYSYPHHILI